ncbi:hypothetical protein HUJ04_011024 [Dendroctonus ponderosae]|nr:hypothetical protein HUJ04_011024 [Dendroctonus ponderosae]
MAVFRKTMKKKRSVDLTDIDRFLYLKLCCKGDALNLIEALEVTGSNYSIAFDLLQKSNRVASASYSKPTMVQIDRDNEREFEYSSTARPKISSNQPGDKSLSANSRLSSNDCDSNHVLLSTATVFIADSSGYWHSCNALLDSGSQSNLISESLCRKLKLKQERINIPLSGVSQLGESKSIALKRFLSLEKRLSNNKHLKHQYEAFMNEYKDLGHMTLKCSLNEDDSIENKSYFLPHSAVLRESITTKCRVVFDASAKSSTNVSFNDLILVGPTIQQDLFSILLRVYQLNTVTYGTSSAPFQATRCLKELAIQNKHKYPRASKLIESFFYMDDLLISVDTEGETVDIYRELSNILSQAGLKLRKWSSNNESILKQILSDNNNENSDNLVLFQGNKELKPLGVVWDSDSDFLKFSLQRPVQLYGFCDSSEKAYGACIYICSIDETDSTIVLAWIRLEPSSLKTFVANRVARIIELSHVIEWNHVVSEDNAADIISRGVNPKELGPSFLRNYLTLKEPQPISLEDLPDTKLITLSLTFNYAIEVLAD